MGRIIKINSFGGGTTRSGYVAGSNISSSSTPNGPTGEGGSVTIFGNTFYGTNSIKGEITDCTNVYATGEMTANNSFVKYTNYSDNADDDPDNPQPQNMQPVTNVTSYGWFTYLGTQSLTANTVSATGVSAGNVNAGSVSATTITSTNINAQTSSLGNATATNLTTRNVTTRTMTANSATIGSLDVGSITINGMSLCQYISTVCGYVPTGGPVTPTGNPYTFSIQGNQTDGYYTLADYQSNMVATNGTARISLADAREGGAVYTETNTGETDVRMTVTYTITGNVQITGISDVNLGGTMLSGSQLMNTTLSNGNGAFLTVTNYAIEYIAPPQYTQIDFYFDLDDGRTIDMNCTLNYQGAMGLTSTPQNEGGGETE